jgi:hypothetical protein
VVTSLGPDASNREVEAGGGAIRSRRLRGSLDRRSESYSAFVYRRRLAVVDNRTEDCTTEKLSYK